MPNQFFELLDRNHPPANFDAAVVLRFYPDIGEQQRRVDRGMHFVWAGRAKYAVAYYQPNTKDEADQAMYMAWVMEWKSLTVVTSHFHHYRAFLTFLKSLQQWGTRLNGLKMYSSPVGSGTIPEEFDKIEAYQKQGHVASYEEGIEYLSCL